MADADAGQQQAEAAAEERGPTRRVVVKREQVIVLPDKPLAEEDLLKAMDALGLKRGRPKVTTAWVVVGEFEGHSKDKAIEAHAGKAGTATAKVGVWKAPSVSAWAGGVEHSAPPRPLIEKKAID